MAVKVLEDKIKYVKRCHCGALLEFEYDDIRFSEVGKFCYEDTVGYITCPNCHKDVYLGSVDELYKLKKNKAN